jgi:PAS domain S-box-containing protein
MSVPHNVLPFPGPASRPRPPAAPDFQALIEAAGDLIYALDLEGRFTYYNRAAAEVLGYPGGTQAMLGVSFLGILTPDSAVLAQHHFTQSLKGQQATPFIEVEARHKDGSIVNLEVRSGTVMSGGVAVGRQGIARNITELKSLQALVSEKTQRMTLLEERMRVAMGLYARIADLVHDDGNRASGDALLAVENTLQRLGSGKHGMSEADITILKLLAAGHSNEAIAGIVCRSPHTIKDTVKRIMQKLGAKRRAEAVACAIRLGLISAD